MTYLMKTGILYAEGSEKGQAKIKGAFCGPEKQILAADGSLLLHTDIRSLTAGRTQSGDVCYREYVMYDSSNVECATAKPAYADEDDPHVLGWPVYRLPKVDHAHIEKGGEDYSLIMQNNQNYLLKDHGKQVVVQVIHMGIGGGWRIETARSFPPEFLCGLFVFCRYLEKENEFCVV